MPTIEDYPNRYIGARYVPIFSDRYWDSVYSYEPLTVVQLPNGDSYTSKQYVPEGIEITNTNFWAHTGNYNYQWEELIESNYIKSFNTRNDLINSIGLNSGDVIYLLGDENSTDGKGGIYQISSIKLNNDSIQINNLYANKLNNNYSINPDNFIGDDSEKLQSAIDFANNFINPIIIITRNYKLTTNINLTHHGDNNNNYVNIIGIGTNNIIDCDNFYFNANNANRGQYTFENISFTGLNKFMETNYIIRCRFINCNFYGFNAVFNITRFLQTFLFSMCLFRDNNIILNGDGSTVGLDDNQFNECTIERNGKFIDVYSAHGVTINQCCIEGNNDTVFTLHGDCRSFNVINNYFESNNNENNNCIFDFSYLQGNIQTFSIENNRFVANSNSILIKMPASNMSTGTQSIKNNWCSNDVILIEKHENWANRYNRTFISGTINAKYNNPTFFNIDDLQYITVLEENSDLNNLPHSGLYYNTNGHSIVNSPVGSNLFYLYHIQRTPIIYYQLLFTSTNVYFRLQGYNWRRIESSEII